MAAKRRERPSMKLMTMEDGGAASYMQMPRWLFSGERYAPLSLDAKVVYTFLLDRFQLSRRNGWVNERGEVYLLFPRRALAEALGVGEKRVTAAFRELAAAGLIWEVRQGRGRANRVYLAALPGLFLPGQEPPEPPSQGRRKGGSRTAVPAAPEPPNPPPSQREKSYPDSIHPDVSHSGPDRRADSPERAARRAREAGEERELEEILDRCELDCFDEGEARVYANAIERLYYSSRFRLGDAVLPQSRVRARLRRMDGMALRRTGEKLRANLDRPVKNSTAYVMAALLNAVTELESDELVDPDLNRLRWG